MFRDTPVLLLVDVIGSIVILLSRCCLPNDEGPAPKYFFLEPPLAAATLQRQSSERAGHKRVTLTFDLLTSGKMRDERQP